MPGWGNARWFPIRRLPNGFNTATSFDITLTFENGSSIVTTPGANGIVLQGERGRIFVIRGRITGRPIEKLTPADRNHFAEEVIRSRLIHPAW